MHNFLISSFKNAATKHNITITYLNTEKLLKNTNKVAILIKNKLKLFINFFNIKCSINTIIE